MSQTVLLRPAETKTKKEQRRPDSVREPSPLRILLASYRSARFTGGQGVYIRYLSKALHELGHKVDVVSGPPYPDLDPNISLIKLPSLDLHAVPNGLMALRWKHLCSYTDMNEWWAHNTGRFAEPYTFGRRLKKYLNKGETSYDIVHDNQSLAWDLLDIQEDGIPIVATIHHPITRDLNITLRSEPSAFMRWLAKRWHSFLSMQKQVARRLPSIIVVSESTKKDLVSDFHLSETQMHVIHNGVDTDLFTPRENIKRKPTRLITTASADVPLKGLVYLLKALHALIPNYPEIELIVIGKPRAGESEELIKKLKLDTRVTFLHDISDEELVNAYAEATIAVCPSVYEGFGFPAAEAMACGVPLVSTTGGALEEVVGDAGLLVPPKNPGALSKAIAMALDNEPLRAQLSQKGRERVLEKFCWKAAAQNYVRLYREAIAHADR